MHTKTICFSKLFLQRLSLLFHSWWFISQCQHGFLGMLCEVNVLLLSGEHCNLWLNQSKSMIPKLWYCMWGRDQKVRVANRDHVVTTGMLVCCYVSMPYDIALHHQHLVLCGMHFCYNVHVHICDCWLRPLKLMSQVRCFEWQSLFKRGSERLEDDILPLLMHVCHSKHCYPIHCLTAICKLCYVDQISEVRNFMQLCFMLCHVT